MSLHWETSYWFTLDCILHNMNDKNFDKEKHVFYKYIDLLQHFFPTSSYGDKFERGLDKYDISEHMCCYDCLFDWYNIFQKYVRGHVGKNIMSKDRNLSSNDLYSNPKYWGPYFWNMMEHAAKSIGNSPSTKNKNLTEKFFLQIEYVLPCEKCAKHYAEFLESENIYQYLCCSDCLLKYIKKMQNNVKSDRKYDDDCVKKGTCNIKSKQVCSRVKSGSLCGNSRCDGECRKCKLIRYNRK